RWLPKGVEVLQYGVGLADDGSGEEAPGEGSEGDAPHAVPAADEDPGRLGGADEGVPVGGDGASADPFLLALVPVDALEYGAGGVDEQRDAPGVGCGIHGPEFHHSADAQPVAEGRAGEALVGEVDGVAGHGLGLDTEAVAAACLHDRLHAVLAAERVEPRAGGDDDGVAGDGFARGGDDL